MHRTELLIAALVIHPMNHIVPVLGMHRERCVATRYLKAKDRRTSLDRRLAARWTGERRRVMATLFSLQRPFVRPKVQPGTQREPRRRTLANQSVAQVHCVLA